MIQRHLDRLVGTIVNLPTKNEVAVKLKLELCGTGIEDLRNIRLLHKAIMDNNGMEIIFQMLNLDALGDARNMFGCHV